MYCKHNRRKVEVPSTGSILKEGGGGNNARNKFENGVNFIIFSFIHINTLTSSRPNCDSIVPGRKKAVRNKHSTVRKNRGSAYEFWAYLPTSSEVSNSLSGGCSAVTKCSLKYSTVGRWKTSGIEMRPAEKAVTILIWKGKAVTFIHS